MGSWPGFRPISVKSARITIRADAEKGKADSVSSGMPGWKQKQNSENHPGSDSVKENRANQRCNCGGYKRTRSVLSRGEYMDCNIPRWSSNQVGQSNVQRLLPACTACKCRREQECIHQSRSRNGPKEYTNIRRSVHSDSH